MRPSHAANHRRPANKDSDNQIGPDSRHSSNSANIPAPAVDGLSPRSKNSPGDQNAQADSRGVGGNGAAAQRRGQNHRDWESNLPGDREGPATTPHKRREKRKHCESAESAKRKRHKSGRDARFEGQRISHLVKKRAYKREENEAEGQEKSDDYVLAKLFKKSGQSQRLLRTPCFNLFLLFKKTLFIAMRTFHWIVQSSDRKWMNT